MGPLEGAAVASGLARTDSGVPLACGVMAPGGLPAVSRLSLRWTRPLPLTTPRLLGAGCHGTSPGLMLTRPEGLPGPSSPAALRCSVVSDSCFQALTSAHPMGPHGPEPSLRTKSSPPPTIGSSEEDRGETGQEGAQHL